MQPPRPQWIRAAATLALCAAGCTLDEVELIAHAPTGPGVLDAGADAGDATTPEPDAAADAGEGCTFAVSAPAEVTLGTRVHVTSGLACAEDPAVHTCTWRAQWSDDADLVEPVEPGPHPCAAGEAFDFTAAASSNDASSVYWVTLAIDGVVTPTRGRASVWVGELRELDLAGGDPLGKIFDIAIHPDTRRAWVAAEAGLFAMTGFADELAELVRPPTDRCNDAVVACAQHTVAVAGGLVFSGRDADADAIVRAQLEGGAMLAEEIALPETGRIRSIVASLAAGASDEPALYVTSPSTTWTVAGSELDAADLQLGDELGTDGADLADIVATAVQISVDGTGEALWRLEQGSSGELQRLEAIGNDPPSLAPEDVLDHNGACAVVWDGQLVVSQRDGRTYVVDLDAIDPGAGEPIADATNRLELPLADDPDGTPETLDRILDLFVSEDGATLWAVSADTLYRVTDGLIFRSRTADVPVGMLSVATLRDGAGDEVVLIGTATGLWLTRADMHSR